MGRSGQFTSGIVDSPSNPAPLDGTNGVPLSLMLSWSSANGALSYDVYLGSSPIPSYLGTTAGTSFNVNSLLSGQGYYWQVVATNGLHSSASPVWKFTPSALLGPFSLDLAYKRRDRCQRLAHPNLTAASGSVSYIVHIGITNPPSPSNDQSVTGISFNPAARPWAH